MNADETYYTDLIIKYLSGEITPEELQVLNGWVTSASDHELEFSRLARLWHTMQHSIPEPVADLDREWEQVSSRINAAKEHKKSTEIKLSRKVEHSGNQRGIVWVLAIAAVALIIVVPLFLLFRWNSSGSPTLVSAATAMTEITLSDGTRVTLNTGSTLTYPSKFKGYLRDVTLTGEAWFEIARDPSRPFTITAENVRIRAIGTSFLVNTLTPDDCKEIILEKGCVKVFYQPRPGIAAVLLPGERAEVATEDYMIMKSGNNNANFLAWKTRHIVFDRTPLEEVVGVLKSVYQTDIVISDERLNNCRISATFDKQSLASVLTVLSVTLDLRILPSGNGFVISGKDCK